MVAPNTRTRLSHALTIRARGRIIGAIHSYAVSQSRTLDTEFEVEANATGMPIELIPQTVDRRELRLSRYDLYTAVMEEVFGSSELVVLTDQYRPVTVREVWRGPGINATTLTAPLSDLPGAAELGTRGVAPVLSNAITSNPVTAAIASVLNAATANTRVYEYAGCWFTDLGRTIDAKSDRVISVEATLAWTARTRVV